MVQCTAFIAPYRANASYSREFEREADNYAYQYLTTNEIQLDSFAIILKKITESDSEPGIENYLSSHPATSERIKRFK